MTITTPTVSPKKRKLSEFTDEYRELQNVISRLTGDPLPPCYFCTAEQLWKCSRTGEECNVFKRYCSDVDN